MLGGIGGGGGMVLSIIDEWTNDIRLATIGRDRALVRSRGREPALPVSMLDCSSYNGNWPSDGMERTPTREYINGRFSGASLRLDSWLALPIHV